MTKEQMKEYLKEGWKAVLPESAAEDSSDFFADGGDSIKAVQLTGWLLQKGLKLDMVKVFTTPAGHELADEAEGRGQAQKLSDGDHGVGSAREPMRAQSC